MMRILFCAGRGVADIPDLKDLEIVRCFSADEALDAAAAGGFGAAALAAAGNGWEEMRKIRSFAPELPLVAIGVSGGNEEMLSALREGAQEYIAGVALSAASLKRAVECAVERKKAEILRRQQDSLLRRAVEERVKQSEKWESLGLLAGGIAHDFNNLLLVMLGNAELALRSGAAASVAPMLEEIRTAALRAKSLTERLLVCAGKARFRPTACDLNALVREVEPLLKVSIKPPFRCELADALPSIECDPEQIKQIILQLMTNAAEAVGDARSEIVLRTGVRRASRHFFEEEDSGGGAADYVFLSVIDKGCGFDERTRRLVFDPFFTTKGHRRGLGLAVAQGMARMHGGWIEASGAPGAGATFDVYLPASSAAVQPRRVPTVGVAIRPVRASVVMVVDDEADVRNVTVKILQSSGFATMSFASGLEAIAALSSGESDVDCVVLDLVMPGMGGKETYQQIRRLKRLLPVLFFSGYSRDCITSILASDPAAGFLHKPASAKEMAAAIKKLLEVTHR